MKRLILSVGIPALTVLLIVQILLSGIDHAGRKNCVCSVLTDNKQTFPIDSRLYSVCEKETLNPGTLRIVRTKCAHGENIFLCIMPDDRKYAGYLLPE